MTPSDENECRHMLFTGYNDPSVVRYPRGNITGTILEPLIKETTYWQRNNKAQGKRNSDS